MTGTYGQPRVVARRSAATAETGVERIAGLDGEALRPERDGEALEEADLSEDDRGSLVRERRQYADDASPRDRCGVDVTWGQGFER